MTKRQTSKGKIAQPIDTAEKAKKILTEKLRECIDILGTYTELVRENRNPEGGQTNTYIKMLEFQQVALATNKHISEILGKVKKIPTLHKL